MTSPLLAGPFATEVTTQLGRLVFDQFLDTGSDGPTAYTEFFESHPGDAERLHAQRSLGALGDALLARGIEISRPD